MRLVSQGVPRKELPVCIDYILQLMNALCQHRTSCLNLLNMLPGMTCVIAGVANDYTPTQSQSC